MQKLLFLIICSSFIGNTSFAAQNPAQIHIAQEDQAGDDPMQNEINDEMSQEVQQEQPAIQQTTVTNVDPTGTFITTQDGSKWKIAEVDRYNSINWQPGDRITIQATGAYFPPYQLTNTVNRSMTQSTDTCGAEKVNNNSGSN